MIRLPDAPILSNHSASVDAFEYNLIHLALVRFGAPQLVRLGARDLDILLEHDLWLCSDRRLDNMPLMAWTRFARGERRGPYAPVRCQIICYHAYARVVGRQALTDVARRLDDALREDVRGHTRVLRWRVRRDR
ncbi:MAG: hypothetical protein M0R77_13335 [Gammaproteobacteria bacterium]|nr:hypothetical protein [Gammaproteobacteria bacterium]